MIQNSKTWNVQQYNYPKSTSHPVISVAKKIPMFQSKDQGNGTLFRKTCGRGISDKCDVFAERPSSAIHTDVQMNPRENPQKFSQPCIRNSYKWAIFPCFHWCTRAKLLVKLHYPFILLRSPSAGSKLKWPLLCVNLTTFVEIWKFDRCWSPANKQSKISTQNCGCFNAT